MTITTDQSDPISIVGTDIRSRISNHAALYVCQLAQPNFTNGCYSFTADAEPDVAPTVIPGRSLRYKILFRHTELGRYEARVEFTFQRAGGQPFIIARRLLVVVGEATDRELLQPVAPYAPTRRARWDHDLPVRAGAAPRSKRTKWSRELLHYSIPSELFELLGERSPQEISARLKEKCFSEPLSLENHLLCFQTLLWAEEHRTV